MGRLSSHVIDIEPSYEVVVVGSGYGASIAACRLARAGKRVCVLERGREFERGQFPESLPAVVAETQGDTRLFRAGSRLALFDIHVNDPVNVVVGCGLGGTSLINANVSIVPDDAVFEDGRWPGGMLEDGRASLRRGYDRAREVLQPNPLPDPKPSPPTGGPGGDLLPAKLLNHQRSAHAMEERAPPGTQRFDRVDINVRFEAGPNAVGVHQDACTRCGNCASGCNWGAKNALTMNYLPDAKAHGARIFTHAEVRHVERAGGRWAVHFVQLDAMDSRRPGGPTQFVFGDLVVLGAGTLGSTEILLRSKKRGLALSSQLGRRFSGNGDQFGFAYAPSTPSNATGWSSDAKPTDLAAANVGPTITSAIRRTGTGVDDQVIIEEGAIPVAIGGVVWSGLELLAGKLEGPATAEARGRATQMYLIMSIDDGRGVVSLDCHERARVKWPDGGAQRDFELGRKYARLAAEGIEGQYLDDPLWEKALGNQLISVHPLGGCAMGDTGASGVVNDRCEVFASEGTDVHDGLYVCDGSVIPSALGVNPLFTISAVAERAMEKLAEKRALTIDYTLPRSPSAEPAAEGTAAHEAEGIKFTEEMKGWFSPGAGDFEAGRRAGEVAGTSLDVRLAIRTDDLEATLRSPSHELRFSGLAIAPSLSSEALTLTRGRLDLFYEADGRPDEVFMRYRARMTSTEGKDWWLDGYKHVGKDSPLSAYDDSRTLYVSLHEGAGPGGAAWARGRLRIDPMGILRLLGSVQVVRARGSAWDVKKKFLRFAAGTELRTSLASHRYWFRSRAPTPLVPPDPPSSPI